MDVLLNVAANTGKTDCTEEKAHCTIFSSWNSDAFAPIALIVRHSKARGISRKNQNVLFSTAFSGKRNMSPRYETVPKSLICIHTLTAKA